MRPVAMTNPLIAVPAFLALTQINPLPRRSGYRF